MAVQFFSPEKLVQASFSTADLSSSGDYKAIVLPAVDLQYSQQQAFYEETPAERAWREQTAVQTSLSALGLYCLNNVRLRGSGFLFKDDSLLCADDLIPKYIQDQFTSDDRWDMTIHAERVIEIEEPVVSFVSDAHRVYGHWILDMLPRIWLFNTYFRQYMPDIKFIIPDNTPAYARMILLDYFGINRRNVIEFKFLRDEVKLKRVYVPSLLHSSHIFHPAMNLFVDFILKKISSSYLRSDTKTKIYLSRRHFARNSTSYERSLQNEDALIEALIARGYQLVYPEGLGWSTQIKLFSQAAIIIGECGSALHNSLFSKQDTGVVSIDSSNHVQGMISNLRHQNIAFVEAEIVNTDIGQRVVDIDRVLNVARAMEARCQQ